MAKVWPEQEESRWYNLHTSSDVAYGERYGYTVIDVPLTTLARWQRVLGEARSVLAEIEVAVNGNGKAHG